LAFTLKHWFVSRAGSEACQMALVEWKLRWLRPWIWR